MDEMGNSRLHLAVQNGNEAEIRDLIDNGANIYAKNDYGRYPAFYALQAGMESMFGLIADASILSEMDSEGRYPIYYMRMNRYTVYSFIQMGGDILSKDKYGKSGIWHIYNSMSYVDYDIFNAHPRLLEHTSTHELQGIDPAVLRYIDIRKNIELWI